MDNFKLEILKVIKNAATECKSCELCTKRTQVVFDNGNPNSSILIVGEAPGATEDQQGIPFVGDAGKVLNEALSSINIQRQNIYISNIVKCRPPQNRVPTEQERNTCGHFLLEEIEVIQPKLIVALGATSSHYLLSNNKPMKELAGTINKITIKNIDYPVLTNYHPASLLYNPKLKNIFLGNFQLILPYIQ